MACSLQTRQSSLSQLHCRPAPALSTHTINPAFSCLQVATKSTFFQQPDFYGVDLTTLHAPATAGYFGQARLLPQRLRQLVSRVDACNGACLFPPVRCLCGRPIGQARGRAACATPQASGLESSPHQHPAPCMELTDCRLRLQAPSCTACSLLAWPHVILSTPASSELPFGVCSSLQVVVDQIPPNVLVSNCVSKTFDFLAITEQVRSHPRL